MMSIQTLHRRSSKLEVILKSAPVNMRKLLQCKQVCSYCRRSGHKEEDCILHDIGKEDDKENTLPKSVSQETSTQTKSLFYPVEYLMNKREITKNDICELIPLQYWVIGHDPVKQFLNYNNIHNYRTQQQWKKKVQYKKLF